MSERDWEKYNAKSREALVKSVFRRIRYVAIQGQTTAESRLAEIVEICDAQINDEEGEI